MIQIIYYLIIILSTFTIGFAILIALRQCQQNWIPKSFLFGTAVLVLLSFWISFCSKNGLKPFALPILFLLFFASIGIIMFRRRELQRLIITKIDIICLILSILSGLIILSLYIFWGAQYPYIDAHTYLCNADYWARNGYNIIPTANDIKFQPWLEYTQFYRTNYLRAGAQMLLAFWSCIFDEQFSIEVFLPLTAFGTMLCGLGGWAFFSQKYTVSPYSKLITLVMICFNVPIILYNAFYGFFPQTFGSAFFLAGLSHFCEWDYKINKSIIYPSILMAALALTYNEILPFLVLLIAVIVVRRIIQEHTKCFQILRSILVCGILSITLISTYFGGMLHAIFLMMNATVGWYQDKNIETYLAYFLSSVPADYCFKTTALSPESFILELVTLLAALLPIIGIYKLKKEIKLEFFWLTVPYALIFLYFIFFTKDPVSGGIGNTWNIFKMMQYYFLVAILLIGIAISKYLEKRGRLAVVFLVVFIGLNTYNGIQYAGYLSHFMKDYTGVKVNPMEQFYLLREKWGGNCIVLVDVPQEQRLLLSYFLRDNHLVIDCSSENVYSYIKGKGLDFSNDNLVILTYDCNGVMQLACEDHDPVCKLYQCNNIITNVQGIYGLEENSDGRQWCWSRRQSEMTVEKDIFSDTEIMLLNLANGSKESNADLDIYVNEKLFNTVTLSSTQETSILIELKDKISNIRFDYKGNVNLSNINDPRELAFIIEGVQFLENHNK